MTFELSGPVGKLVFEESGALRFMLEERCLLQTALAPAFGEMYGVNLTLNLAEVRQQEDGLLLHFAIPAKLATHATSLTVEVYPTEFGFRLTVSAPPPVTQAGVNFDLQPAGPWYGLGERVIQS